MKLLQSFFGLFIVLALSYFAVSALFVPGFFPMHDDTQPSRVFEMHKALSDGHFPVRWVSDLGYGYGYPIFNFYAPFAYYIGAVAFFVTADILIATKIMIGLGVIAAGVFMYFLGKELFGDYGGVVAALAYVYAPYHAVDIYVRGDVAELWAYAFIPLTFYSVWKLFNTQKTRYIFIGAVSMSFMVISHNLTALMLAPFLGSFLLLLIILSYKKNDYMLVKNLVTSVVLSILLSAFYSLPTLLEMRYTNVLSQIGGGADFRDHFVCMPQLWSSNWGFGGSVAGCIDGMSFKIGKVHVILAGISIFFAILLFLRRIADASYVLNPKGIFFFFSIFGFIISSILTTDLSKIVWEIIPTMSFFQYPWRFLILASFFTSLLCGFFVWSMAKSLSRQYHSHYLHSYVVTVLIVISIVYINHKWFAPQTITPKAKSDYISQEKLLWDISKISDEYMPPHFQKPTSETEVPKNDFTVLSDQVVIKDMSSSTTHLSATVTAASDDDLRLNLAYFPSWRLFVDKEERNFTIDGKGILIKIPAGRHIVEGRFVSTQAQTFGNMLSVFGLISLFIGIIFSVKHKIL